MKRIMTWLAGTFLMGALASTCDAQPFGQTLKTFFQNFVVQVVSDTVEGTT